MSAADKGSLNRASEAGIAGAHPPGDPLRLLVGPTVAAEFNTMRLPLKAIGCWRLEDARFEFDSSFVVPEVRNEMPLLALLISDLTDPQSGKPPPISLFGHADPVGNDVYNKALSGRRAAAIYGMLTRRDEVWEDLFNNQGRFTQPAVGDKWGTRSIQIMLSELVSPIAVDGVAGPETQGAVREFQSSKGLAVDGNPGPATRKELFLAYMEKICIDPEDKPFQVDAKDGFLAHNADAQGKGDFQGCSEFNPVLIFSQVEEAEFAKSADHTRRNAENAPNRRVLALLFRPGSVIDAARWPCPRAKEGLEDCRKRLWSDAETRRGLRLADERREFKKTRDTFGCRFYHRLTETSPCETLDRGIAVYRVNHEIDGEPVRNTLFEIAFPDGSLQRRRTDENGVIRIIGVEGQQFTMVAIADDKHEGTIKDATVQTGA